MALYGGIYLPCLFGLLPDKSQETYDRFFAMVWSYNDKNGLPNGFQDQFFMCDFEINIRNSVLLYWPTVKPLGCYFHFSQVQNNTNPICSPWNITCVLLAKSLVSNYLLHWSHFYDLWLFILFQFWIILAQMLHLWTYVLLLVNNNFHVVLNVCS